MSTEPSRDGFRAGETGESASPAHWIHRLDHAVGTLGRQLHRFGMVWVLGILAVTVADILGRYCAGRPVTGALELGEAMLAVMGYCGMAATQRAGGNVRVSFLWNRLRGSLGRAARVLASIPGVVVMGLLSWRGVVATKTQFRAGTLTDALHVPVYPLYIVLALGATALTLELAMEILREISNRNIPGMRNVPPDRTGKDLAS